MKQITALILLLVLPLLSQAVTVGSKNFSESYLLGEVVAQLLESEGFDVDRRFGLGGTLVCYEALLNHEIDVYVEYTGTAEQVILKGGDLHPSIESINTRLDPALSMLASLGFNNTYAMALKASQAETLGLFSLSQLAEHPELVLALSLEFLNREDGWPGLSSIYQLPHEPTGIDHGLAYQAIVNGSIDLTDAYSTDGDLERYDLRILTDDRNYFPDYFAAPFVNNAMPAAARQVISRLAGRFTDDRMRQLNAEVVINERSFADVAAQFLAEEGLVAADRKTESRLLSEILANTLDHLQLTSIALLLGCLFGLPVGILVYRNQSLARAVVYVAGLLQTIPSIALLALMIPLFGIGMLPAIVALFLYSILPILRNTITALLTIDPVLKRVAAAIGLSRSQQLRYVLLPMALPGIMAGIRTAAVISIGTATLAAFIGAGGLGEPIVTGLALNDTDLILQGALPAALLAILVELSFELLERRIVRPHMVSGELTS